MLKSWLAILILGSAVGLSGLTVAQANQPYASPTPPPVVTANLTVTQVTVPESAGRVVLPLQLTPMSQEAGDYIATFDVSMTQIRNRGTRAVVTLATSRLTVTGGLFGPTTTDIVLNIADDAVVSPDQVFSVTVIPTGLTIFTNAVQEPMEPGSNTLDTALLRRAMPRTLIAGNLQASVTVQNDDVAPPVAPDTVQFFREDYNAREDQGFGDLIVRRSGSGIAEVTVQYQLVPGTAVAGTDYVDQPGQLRWAPGDLADKTLRVVLINDTTAESTERMTVKLLAPVNATLALPLEASLTIADDDAATPAPTPTPNPNPTPTPSPTPADILSGAGQNPTQQSIGAYIGTICATGRPGSAGTAGGADLQARCNDMVGAAIQGDGNVPNALQQVASEEFATQTTAAVETAGVQFGNLYRRLNQLRTGAKGVNVAGLSMRNGENALDGSLLAALWPQGAAAGADEHGFDRWGFFATGSADWGERDPSRRESGFDFETRGLTLGADYRFSDQFVLGAALGYARTDNDISGNGGKIDIDGYSVSLFGTYYQTDNFFVDGVLHYGSSDYENQRAIRYSLLSATGVDQLARSTTESDQYGFSLGAGYIMPQGALTFTSNARLEYVRAEVDAFSETIVNATPGFGLGLQLDDQEVESLTLTLGGQLSYALSRTWGVLLPYASFDWVHEFDDDARRITGKFVSDPGLDQFALATDDPDRDYFTLGFGVAAQFAQGRSAFIQYRTTLGLEDVESDSLSAGIRLEF